MKRLLTVLFALSLPAVADPTPDTLEIAVEDLHSNNGRVSCALFSKPDGFPTRSEQAISKTSATIQDRRATCSFTGVAPGTYAVAVFHDENANGKLDTNFIGIPNEGLASSRDAKGFFGPPKFADASFPYPGAGLRLVVHIKYL